MYQHTVPPQSYDHYFDPHAQASYPVTNAEIQADKLCLSTSGSEECDAKTPGVAAGPGATGVCPEAVSSRTTDSTSA